MYKFVNLNRGLKINAQVLCNAMTWHTCGVDLSHVCLWHGANIAECKFSDKAHASISVGSYEPHFSAFLTVCLVASGFC